MHLERASLVSEAVKDARARAKKVVHASVCTVQVGVKLKGVINGDGCVCVLYTQKDLIQNQKSFSP